MIMFSEPMHGEQPTQATHYRQLELSFLGSMLPGIIHNISTPLSGVIGATQLMESRVSAQDELMSRLAGANDEVWQQLQTLAEKNRKNLDIINRNATQLIDIVQVLVQRIQRSGLREAVPQSLNDLVKAEIEFLAANLTFKHRVRKEINLADEPFAVRFVYGNLATVIDEFVEQTVGAHDVSQGMMEMSFTTEFSDSTGTLRMQADYSPLDPEEQGIDSIGLYLARTREDGCRHELSSSRGSATLTLCVPRGTVVESDT